MPRTLAVAVLASGRGSNFEALAKACRRAGFPASIELLITDNPSAGAIGVASSMDIPFVVVDCGPKRGSMSPDSSAAMTRVCEEHGIGLVCLAGFMRIVKGEIMQRYAGRMLNIHPALLPSFKGLDGQKQALEYGVRYTGCTVHFVDEGVDTGPIVTQRVVPVRQDDDVERLSARILAEEHIAYSEAVRLFAEGRLRFEGRKVIVSDESK